MKMIHVTDEAHKALKIKAAELEMKLQEATSEAILSWVAKVKKPKVKTTKNKEA